MRVVSVPARGRKWVADALVRDGRTLFRVVGKPIHYHEDCLAMQEVSQVRKVPEDWQRVSRLLEIMDLLKTTGYSTSSRSVRPVAPYPTDVVGDAVRWTARDDPNSYAQFPYLDVRGDVLLYVEPIYDDEPIVGWLRDQALADEARELISHKPSLAKYPCVSVRTV